MKSETLAERNARLAAEQRAEDAEKRAKDLEDKISKQARPVTSLETINVGDKSFYTDKALKQMVEAGQLTDEEAYNHQQDRIQEVAADRAYQRIKIEGTREEEKKVRADDAKKVLSEFPEFDKKHPSHNPDDPLYKEWSRLYQRGYYANWNGASEALEDAKRILRYEKSKPDVSDDLSVHRSTNYASQEKGKEVKVEFSDYEKDLAVRLYRDKVNPATGRVYTEKESVDKAMKAKASRQAVRK